MAEGTRSDRRCVMHVGINCRCAEEIERLQDRVAYLERLLSRAYPWLHNPYHGTSDYANEAEGDAVIEAVQTAIQHVPDEPDPLLNLPCASCDGRGCENCAPINPCGADDGSAVCIRDAGHPIPHRAADGRQWI